MADKQSDHEERMLLEATFDAITDGIFIVDAVTRKIIRTNKAALDITGYDVDELVGRNTAFLHVDQEAYEKFGVALRAALEQRHALHTEYQVRRKDGVLIDTEHVVAAAFDGEGAPRLLVSLVKDVTELKRKEAERARLEEKVRQAQKMESIGRLAGGIAHDFNNRLTTIIGNIEIARQDLSPEDPLQESLGDVLEAASSAAELTAQLLAFSRKQVIQVQAVNLNTLLEDLHRTIERVIGEDITLVTNEAADLWSIEADAGQIEQVIVDLLMNAREAMPQGGTITVQTANVHMGPACRLEFHEMEPGDYVLLRIADTGYGMDEETRQSIFVPFFTTKTTGQRTGLGLATVYGIVRQHGGHISVESAPGRGTVFKLYFARTDMVSRGTEERGPGTASSVEETVLVVEDEPAVRSIAVKILDRQGYAVLQAESGEAALALIEKKHPHIDLLLTDVVMPGINGRELAERLLANSPDLKVLFVSGYTREVVAQRGFLGEGVEFLPKPYTPQSLTRKVRETLCPSC